MGPAAILSVLVQAKGVREVQRDLGKVDKAGRSAGAGMAKFQKVAGAGILAVGAAAAVAGPKLISLASDAEETASKFKIVFGKETQDAIKQLDAFSKATGTSKFALREQAAQLQALIKPMGLTGKAASGMSVGLTKLATDLASFNNSSVEEAITALQSGLVGEAEPLRRFGVQLSSARVEAFAYAEGIAKQGATLTAAQKAQASYAIILKDTQLAQGDATRTADSFANQWKRLKSQITDVATELGVRLIPIVTTVVSSITGFISKIRDGGDATGGFGRTVKSVFEAVKGAVGTAIGFLRGQFNEHRDDLANVRGAVRNIGIAVREVWEHVVLPVIRRVLPGIVAIIKGAFDVIGGIIKTVSSLIKGDWRAAWDGIKQIATGALQGVMGIIRAATAPLRELASRVGNAIKKPFVDAFNAIKSVAEDVLGVFNDIVGVVKDIIDFIGQIKIPKIDIPFIGGSPRPGFEQKAATGGTGGTYGIANQVASKFGLRISSGWRSPSHNAAVGGVPGSLHTHGSASNPGAIDLVGSAAAMYAASAWAASHLRLAENLVHDAGSGLHLHLGFFKRGGKVPGAGSGDTVPAMLEPGEFVIQKKIVDQFGPTFFAGLNGMRKGGRVGKKTKATMEAIAAAAQGSSRQPFIEQAAALAELTEDLADDIRAADEMIRFWEGQLRIAFASGRGITAAAQGLKGARDARSGLTPTPGGGADNTAAILELAAALDRQTKMNEWMIKTQGPSIVNAVVAAVNGGIGGPVGLGFQGIRSAPGSVAGL